MINIAFEALILDSLVSCTPSTILKILKGSFCTFIFLIDQIFIANNTYMRVGRRRGGNRIRQWKYNNYRQTILNIAHKHSYMCTG